MCTVSNSSIVYGIFVRLGDVVALDVTLERRIRELCAQAVATPNTDELQPILWELRNALHDHAERLKRMVAEYPFSPAEINKPAA